MKTTILDRYKQELESIEEEIVHEIEEDIAYTDHHKALVYTSKQLRKIIRRWEKIAAWKPKVTK